MKYHILLRFHSIPYISAFIGALSAYNYHAHLELFTDNALEAVISTDDESFIEPIKHMAAQQGAILIKDMPDA